MTKPPRHVPPQPGTGTKAGTKTGAKARASGRAGAAPAQSHEAPLRRLCDKILDAFFLDDGNVAAHHRIAGQAAGPYRDIDTIDMIGPPAGAVTIGMHPGSPVLTLTVRAERFEATVSGGYDFGDGAAKDLRVIAFAGDARHAESLLTMWIEEMDAQDDAWVLDGDDAFDGMDDDAGDDDGTDVDGAFDDDDSPFGDAADPGAPPPPSDADIALVGRLAKAVAREMRRRKPDMMAHHDGLLALEGAPQTLWPILDGLVAACQARKRDDALIDAWRLLLDSQLTLIRYRIERGWPWAQSMVDAFLQRLIAVGSAAVLTPDDFAMLCRSLGEARIRLSQETRVELAEAGLVFPDEPSVEDMRGMMAEVLVDLAEGTDDPFEVAHGMGEALQVMPTEMRCFMAHEFALSAHRVLRETVPLMLLEDDQDVRRAAAAALEQIAVPETMSPVMLRRMIAIRNWLPQADRAAADQAIRKARTRGVECAPWPPAADLDVYASVIDGSGAQHLLLAARGRKGGLLVGLLLKRDGGVSDAWLTADASSAQIRYALDSVGAGGSTLRVERSYLDAAVQHAIAVGVQDGGMPPHRGLLACAEVFGGSAWQDRRLDIAAETARRFLALPEDARSADAIEASLKRSGRWIDYEFAQSWFLDDAAARAIATRARLPRGQKVDQVLRQVMPDRVSEWIERFLLLGLRAAAAEDKVERARAGDFIVLAHALLRERPVSDVPLMVGIAETTVDAAMAGPHGR